MKRKTDITILRNFIYILLVSLIIFYAIFFTDFGGNKFQNVLSWSDNWVAADQSIVNTNRITAKAQKETL